MQFIHTMFTQLAPVGVDNESSARFSQWRKASNLSYERLALATGMSVSLLTKVGAAQRPVSPELAQALQSAFGVRAQWLLHGEGAMEVPLQQMPQPPPGAEHTPTDLLSEYRAIIDDQRELIRLLKEELAQYRTNKPNPTP